MYRHVLSISGTWDAMDEFWQKASEQPDGWTYNIWRRPLSLAALFHSLHPLTIRYRFGTRRTTQAQIWGVDVRDLTTSPTIRLYQEDPLLVSGWESAYYFDLHRPMPASLVACASQRFPDIRFEVMTLDPQTHRITTERWDGPALHTLVSHNPLEHPERHPWPSDFTPEPFDEPSAPRPDTDGWADLPF